jgi:hypothetical protein
VTLRDSKDREVELSNAFGLGDDVLCYKIQQHFGSNNRGLALVNEGQTADKKVYGGVQVEPKLDYAQYPLHHDHIES